LAIPIVRWLLGRGASDPAKPDDRVGHLGRLAIVAADVALVAVLAAWAAASTSSLFPVDWARAQRGTLGAWLLVHDPFALAIVALGVASVGRSNARSPSLELALAVALAMVGFGAWNLPTVTIDAATAPGAIAAGLVLSAKSCAIVIASRALAMLAPRPASASAIGRAYLLRLPLAIAGAVISLHIGRSAHATAVGHAFAATLVVLAAVAALALLARVAHAMRAVQIAHADPQS
ncbi:MAG: hypothetical protein ACHREM_26065, partial [Polyangiales bacterium]